MGNTGCRLSGTYPSWKAVIFIGANKGFAAGRVVLSLFVIQACHS
jgi:hypothetical protein